MAQTKALPPNRDGYKYCWVEDDEALCKRYIKKFLSDSATRPKITSIPQFLKKRVHVNVVKLSDHDRAPQLKLDEANNRVTGDKGYSMIRATHGINRGKYYFEVHINSMPPNTATRIGWGLQNANIQAPLGYDHYGYSWRSRFGTKFHQARGMTFDKRGGGYKQGDIIGCMIDLPYCNSKNQTEAKHLPESIKVTGSVVVKYGKKVTHVNVIEETDDRPPLSKMKILEGSKISFYKNGYLVGVAFEDIFEGHYFPTISLYKSCSVTANFGPKFHYPPENFNSGSKIHVGFKPASEIADICAVDHTLSDLLYIVSQENEKNGKNHLEEMLEKSKVN